MTRSEYIARLLPGSFCRLAARMAGKRFLLPYYHVISDDPLPHVHNLFKYKGIGDFVKDLDWMVARYRPMDLNDVLRTIERGDNLPARAFLLTFDDGYSEMESVVRPILEKKGIPAVFFITSSFLDNRNMGYMHKASLIVDRIRSDLSGSEASAIGMVLGPDATDRGSIIRSVLSVDYAHKTVLDDVGNVLAMDFDDFLKKRRPYLSSDQVEVLKKSGFGVGAHSVDHPCYADLSLEDQVRQTVESIDDLCSRFTLPYRTFAFPHSDNGVSRSFFDHELISDKVQLSFGTGGMISDSCPFNFQRFSFEKPLLSAERLLGLYWARGIKGRLAGRGTIKRDGSSRNVHIEGN